MVNGQVSIGKKNIVHFYKPFKMTLISYEYDKCVFSITNWTKLGIKTNYS